MKQIVLSVVKIVDFAATDPTFVKCNRIYYVTKLVLVKAKPNERTELDNQKINTTEMDTALNIGILLLES